MAKHVFGLLLGLVVAMALLAAGANAVSCTTDKHSPNEADATESVQYIRTLGGIDCCQQVNGDNSCTTMYTFGSARVKICGTYNKCTECITAGEALNEVLADCPKIVDGTVRCSGSETADGFKFVLEGNNGVGKKNTTAKVIEMVRDE